jgi:hypothetical protein
MKEPSGRKSYTEEFKKEVVKTALTGGTSLSAVARKYEINLTLVRNWKANYEAEILQQINGSEANDGGTDDDIPTPTAIWHIDRAKFVFSDPAEYKKWKKEKKVFFEFSPTGSDDGGEAVFADPEASDDDFEVTEDRGLVKVKLEKDGPVITAWVGVLAETVEELDQEMLTDWANDQGGWACSTIHLGEFEASIVEDDGGDWRLVEDDNGSETNEADTEDDIPKLNNSSPSRDEEISMLKFELENTSHNFHCYIAANEGFVSSIILYSIFPKPSGDVWYGAYYGAVGGGESDGGYFRINIEEGSSDHLDYDEVDGLSEDDPEQASIFQAVMEALWTLIDDDEGDLTLSEEGSKHYSPDEDGIWIDEEFDGDSLDEISQQWKIRLKFTS